MPFHISNYVRGQLAAEVNQTEYRLRDTTNFAVPEGTPALPDLTASTNRTLPIFGFGLKSGVDRVYDLEQGNWLSEIVDSGVDNSRLRLQRLKHTIEPSVSYTYIPEVSQGQLPTFDSLDRYTQRSVLSYGYTSRLFGRFLRPLERSRDIGELTPSSDTLPMFDLSNSVLQFGRNSVLSPVQGVSIREGEIREIASFTMRQTYDYFQDTQEVQPLLNRFSDILIGGTVSPSCGTRLSAPSRRRTCRRRGLHNSHVWPWIAVTGKAIDEDAYGRPHPQG